MSELERFGEASPPVPARAKMKYDVPSYTQGDLSLCWAFCEVMIYDYNQGTHFGQENATAQAIALAKSRAIFGDWNRGRKARNRGKAVPVQNIHELYTLLRDQNGPLYARYTGVAATDGSDVAHLVVITGVNLATNSVYTNNPWGRGNNGTLGGKYSQTFEEFLSDVAWDGGPHGYEFNGVTIHLIK